MAALFTQTLRCCGPISRTHSKNKQNETYSRKLKSVLNINNYYYCIQVVFPKLFHLGLDGIGPESVNVLILVTTGTFACFFAHNFVYVDNV